MSSRARLAAGGLVFLGVVQLVVTSNSYHLASGEARIAASGLLYQRGI